MTFGTGASTSSGITAMCHWQFHWYNVMPMVSHNQTCHIASQYDYLDLRNAVVPLMTPLVPYDSSAGDIGVTWLQKHWTPFQPSWPKEYHDTTDAWTSCNAGAKGITWPKMSCCISNWLTWPKECNCVIDDTIGIMWHECQCHHMTKSHVATHFGYLYLRNVMMPSVSCDPDTGANGLTWPKSHVAPHFHCLDLRNAMVPLMMLSAACYASTNGVTWSCYTSFQVSWHMEYIGAIGDGINIM